MTGQKPKPRAGAWRAPALTALLAVIAAAVYAARVPSGASPAYSARQAWAAEDGAGPSDASASVPGAEPRRPVEVRSRSTATAPPSRQEQVTPPPPADVPPPYGWPLAQGAPEPPRKTVDVTRPTPTRQVRAANVRDLEAAVRDARPGDEILLTPGTTYDVRNGLRLRPRSGGGWVILRTDLPYPEGVRVDSTLDFATITCTGGGCAPLRADEGGDFGWRFELVEFSAPDGTNAAIYLHPETVEVPDRFIFDRVYVHAAGPTTKLHRCILGNASNLAVVHSVISECHEPGTNSQGFVAWNTPGPILIRDNFISAPTIPILFGGADARNADLVPADIVVAQNHIYRPQSWKGGPWDVKNLFELKVSKRIHIWGNVFENHWRQAQQGYAILLKSTNQSGGFGDHSVTEDVYFERNILRNIDMGFNLARATEGAILPMSRVWLENIVIEGMGPNGPNGDGTSQTFLIQGPDDLTIRNVTSLNPGMHSAFYWASKAGNRATIENVVIQGPTRYGVLVRANYGSWNFSRNFAPGDDCSNYPGGWSCGRPAPGAGADMAAIEAATAGVVR